MIPYKMRDGLPKYMVQDLFDINWCRRSDSMKYILKIAGERRKEKPDSVLQLYRLDGDGYYRPAEFPESSKTGIEACTRNGIVCGHRRPLIRSHLITRCMYILDTGQKRECPCGNKCDKYTTENCRERNDLPIYY